MTFQTTVNKNLALGVVGEYADDGAHRESGYILLAKTTAGVAAEGTLTFTANPSANDSVTIANVTYTFSYWRKNISGEKIYLKLKDKGVAPPFAQLEPSAEGEQCCKCHQ